MVLPVNQIDVEGNILKDDKDILLPGVIEGDNEGNEAIKPIIIQEAAADSYKVIGPGSPKSPKSLKERQQSRKAKYGKYSFVYLGLSVVLLTFSCFVP